MIPFMYLPIEEWINQVYAFIGHWNLSVTALAAAAVIFGLALLFAVREAASWFFKVDHVRRDIKKLHKIHLDLESEVRSLHTLIEAAQANTRANSHMTPAMSPPLAPLATTTLAGAPAPEKSESSKSGNFPIQH
jgi:hypothetical protein